MIYDFTPVDQISPSTMSDIIRRTEMGLMVYSTYCCFLIHHHTSNNIQTQWADSLQYQLTASLWFRAWPLIWRLLRESKSITSSHPFPPALPPLSIHSRFLLPIYTFLDQTSEYEISTDISLYFPETGFVDRSQFTESDTHTHCGWKGMFYVPSPFFREEPDEIVRWVWELIHRWRIILQLQRREWKGIQGYRLVCHVITYHVMSSSLPFWLTRCL